MARHWKKTQKHSSGAVPFLPPSAQGSGARYAPPAESNDDGKAGESAGKSHPEEGKHGIGEINSMAGPELAPGLYVTATPIGNAADLTLRALNVLKHCDAIVAEDTRVTSKLLSLYGISRPLLVYNDHNAGSMRSKLLQRLRQDERLALVSDAGTPLVSDPGHKLVREALEQGLSVFPVPGASAALAALVVSGLPSDRFFFAGFLSARSGERRAALEALRAVPATLVFFESAQRLGESLATMAEVLGERNAAVARELTKLHEEVRRAPLDELAAHYSGSPPRGEIVVLVGPPLDSTAPDMAHVDSLLVQALPFMPLKAAAGLVSDATGVSRRIVYDRALALKNRSSDDAEA